jgi:hypothetical protein
MSGNGDEPVSVEVLQARYLAARDALLDSARDRRPISRRMVLEAVEHIETYIDATICC